ncbi:MAG: AAA family ATPase [Verrucomicrobiota bacterium]|nr:AAA family ATPase [Verrucomicrobiota bacterium]
MPELDSISIKGFKSIASVEHLKLGAINIVIGPNGSGKSNFIGVFSFLNAIREGRLQEYVIRAGGADKILHFGSRQTPGLSISLSFKEERNAYEISLSATNADGLRPSSEFVSFWNKAYPQPFSQGILSYSEEAGISSSNNPIANHVRRHLASWRLYHFHDTSSESPMKKTADVNDNRFLRPDASNLPAFLYLLKKQHEGEYGLIRKTVQQVAPFFKDFTLEPQRLNPEKIRLEWQHQGRDSYFDVSSLSDGTLRFVALATLFLQPESLRPSVILVDEPELGLHPYAITLLAALIKQASVTSQVIVSTQSSLLLDHFEPEDVLVADRVDGGTHFTRLNPEKLEVWLDEYSLGQLWEKNEIGGRPSGG